MAFADLTAALAMFLPAAAVVWFLLGRYEGYFEHNRLFFAMGVGIFAALVVRFLEVRAFGFDMPSVIQPDGKPFTTGTLVYSFSYTSLGYGLVEALAMTAILGFGKFRSRKDSPYYGMALGLAFGAMWSTEFVAAGLAVTGTGRLVTSAPALIYDAFLFLLGFGLLLLHGAAGTWIGRECGNGKLARAGVFGSLWLAIGLAMEWLWLNTHDQVYPALGGLAWGALAIYVADRRILQVIVPAEMRDMIRKGRRRQRRKAA